MSKIIENLELNEFTDEIQFHNCNVLDWNKLDYDIILANINRNVIENLLYFSLAHQPISLQITPPLVSKMGNNKRGLFSLFQNHS